MLAFDFFGAAEGGLFDINATLPLMAIQVVALTYILNSLFFKPVGKVVEKREKFVSNNIMEAKNKLSEVKKLEADLLKGERKVEVWADSIGVKIVNIDYKKPDPFFNINTKEDLDKAVKEIQND